MARVSPALSVWTSWQWPRCQWSGRHRPLARAGGILSAALALAAVLAASPALAQPGGWVDPASGIEFVRITHPGNAPWTGGGFNNNRGAVGYEFAIGRFEVTSAQWVEFFNAAFDRPRTDRIPHVQAPFAWGGVFAPPQTPGGRRWAVPEGNELRPVGGISWRTAAIYCNWLHNGKGTDREAFLNGAYDVSTFGVLSGRFTDQLTRHADARYWIPSLDEWMKAAHYDPSKVIPDGTTGGWWEYSNGSDTPFVYGPPGVLVNGQPATANAGWDDFTYPGLNPYTVPLGAYAGVTSPWGLLDVAGATSEWTEGYFQIPDEPLPTDRLFEGSAWRGGGGLDRAGFSGGEWPGLPDTDFGLRVATHVPSPATIALGFVTMMIIARRRRS